MQSHITFKHFSTMCNFDPLTFSKIQLIQCDKPVFTPCVCHCKRKDKKKRSIKYSVCLCRDLNQSERGSSANCHPPPALFLLNDSLCAYNDGAKTMQTMPHVCCRAGSLFIKAQGNPDTCVAVFYSFTSNPQEKVGQQLKIYPTAFTALHRSSAKCKHTQAHMQKTNKADNENHHLPTGWAFAVQSNR